MHRKLIITVTLAVLLVGAMGLVGAQNASDYPPVGIDAEIQQYDGNGTLDGTVALNHSRGYDDEALAVFDCSVGDCSDTTSGGNLTSFDGSDATLHVVSTNNMDISKNADAWEFVENGTSPEAVVEIELGQTATNGTGTFSVESSGGELAAINGSVGAYLSLYPGTDTRLAENGTDMAIYQNGTQPEMTSAFNNVNDISSFRLRFSSNSTLSGFSAWDRTVSSGEASLLADGYRIGEFVPSSITSTERNLGAKASLTLDVDKLRDAEQTVKVQYYDGAEWQTEDELTVSQTAEYDLDIQGGERYRYVSEPNSTVDSGGGGFFSGGSGYNILYIFGYPVNQGTATGVTALFALLLVVAYAYPGYEGWGKGS